MRHTFPLLLFIFFSYQIFSQTIGDSSIVMSNEDSRKFEFFLFEGSRSKMLGQLDEAKSCFYQCYLINKDSPIVLFELAQLLSNSPTQAISLMESAVNLSPTNVFYLDYLARLYYSVGMYDRSLSTFTRIYEIDTEDQEFIYFLSKTAYNVKDYNTSLRYMNLLEEKVGSSFEITQEKFLIYGALNQKSKQEALLKSYIARVPANKEASLLLAKFYLTDLNKSEKASKILLSIKDDSTVRGQASLYLSDYYYSKLDSVQGFNYLILGLSDSYLNSFSKLQTLEKYRLDKSYTYFLQLDRTVEFLTTIQNSSKSDPAAILLLGYYYRFDKSDDITARDFFLQAITLDPTKFDAWTQVLFMYVADSNYEQVYKYSGDALIYFPTDPTILYFNGLSSSVLEKNSNALISLESARNELVFTKSENINLLVGVLSTLAEVYYRLDSTNLCFSIYEELLKIDPKNIGALNNYAYFIAEKGSDLSKAESMSSVTIQLEPGNATFLDTYAWILFKLQRFTEAKFIIERAMDNGGDSSEVVVEHYGDILSKVGSLDDAVRFWKLSLEMGNKSEKLTFKIKNQTYIE